jgi:hypothetical protein
LRASFGLVALISLTAPLVVIHASTSYVDLFGNSLLAIGACSCLRVLLFPDDQRRIVLVGGLTALAGAAWCKYLLVPVAAVGFCVFTFVALRRPRSVGFNRRQIAVLCAAVALFAVAPYVKNCIVYGNPFWPLRLPLIGQLLPYTNDAIRGGQLIEQPAKLRDHAPAELFIRSLFEVGVPTSYPWRPRWLISQGDSELFRMGGYWNVAVAFYLITVLGMLGVCRHRRGLMLGAVLIAGLGFVAILPQAHELRYYMFIPLSGAAAIGMLLPRFKEVAPHAALGLLTLVIGLFLHMVSENWDHYRVERIDHAHIARASGMPNWWTRLERGKTYCAVDMAPIAFLLTGPTLSEYEIVDRSRADLCPPGSTTLSR